MNKAVFLDRDGVINREVDLLHRLDQLEILPGVPEAIQQFNQNNIKVIVITNQPVVARGLCTEKDINDIHEKMQQLLENQNAFLDDIFFCPHHENADLPKYRQECRCRKPNPGMILDAQKKFNINIKQSFMIGDRTADIKAGETAGVKTILVKTGYAGKDKKYEVKPDFICSDLKDASDLVIKYLNEKGKVNL